MSGENGSIKGRKLPTITDRNVLVIDKRFNQEFYGFFTSGDGIIRKKNNDLMILTIAHILNMEKKIYKFLWSMCALLPRW